MVDDILNSGKTFAQAARLLKEAGSGDIYACASHALLSPPAKETLNGAPIEDICVTDSCLTDESRHPENLTYVTCSKLMGEAVKRIHENTPMSPLFKLDDENYL
jgi:ribose-phosphate pyrophosphokinase